MILKKKIQNCLLQNPSLIVIILLLLKCKTNKFTSGHVRKPSCRYGEIRIRITLYRSQVGISDVVPGVQQCASDESAVLQNLCSRDDPQIVPRYTHRAVARVRGGGLRRRRFPTFTMPSLAPLPPPAASPRFIIHLSCFTLLEQQSSLTRQITGRGNEERSRSFDRPRRHFLKSVGGGVWHGWRNRRFIYLSAVWKKPRAPHEVLYLSCKP